MLTKLFYCVFITGAACLLKDFIGKGEWSVSNLQTCPNAEDYPIQVDLKRRKMNRTHDGFNLTLTLPEDVTETSHGVLLEVCKYVDGGCKIQHILKDDSFCKFARKYIKENLAQILTLAERPPDCPVTAGYVASKNIIFDYTELPEDGFYGLSKASIYLLKGDKRVFCFSMDVSFTSNKN